MVSDTPTNNYGLLSTQMARINRTNTRADKTKVVGIRNMKRRDGTPIMVGGKLDKELEHYTMRCPICETEGRYDDRGDVVCDDDSCGGMITGTNENMVYPEGSGGDGSNPHFNSYEASGHPLMRAPALNDAGPSANDAL